MTSRAVSISVETGNALAWKGDVLVVKYAQKLYGVDAAVYAAVSRMALVPLPGIGETILATGTAEFGAAHVVFIGVPPLGVFGYADVRDFGHRALSAAGVADPAARRLALTLQGVGFGLDETEAFEAELAGIVDAVEGHDMPPGLASVAFVERDARRARRMAAVLARLLPGGRIVAGGAKAGADGALGAAARATLSGVGRASAHKPKVFVAMPFAPEMDDVFHYGIQGAANAAGLLCERADLASFTGDVVEWVKARIAAARLVVADLSTANPNVYLEVGYAWGKGVPTVLLARAGHELKFDVKTQRCIVYTSIHDLEQSLSRELRAVAPPASP